jgi:hypothetical protein
MEYKYRNIISALYNCPPYNCYSAEIDAFRFVHKDINHENNFLPGILIKPNRTNDQSDKFICSYCGLSFFSSIDQAKTRYSKLRFSKKIAKIIGTHIAHGKLAPDDGVITPPNEEGHFDLHEFESANLKTKFTIICEA